MRTIGGIGLLVAVTLVASAAGVSTSVSAGESAGLVAIETPVDHGASNFGPLCGQGPSPFETFAGEQFTLVQAPDLYGNTHFWIDSLTGNPFSAFCGFWTIPNS